MSPTYTVRAAGTVSRASARPVRLRLAAVDLAPHRGLAARERRVTQRFAAPPRARGHERIIEPHQRAARIEQHGIDVERGSGQGQERQGPLTLARTFVLGQPRRVRIWITGAGGFVGRRLSARLRAAGHAVSGVDREVEITDAARVARSLASARADAVVHLAAMSSPAHALRDPEPAARVNYWGTHAVLEAVRGAAPDARVLLVTSGEVYGSTTEGAPPFREPDPLAPRTPYARSKACADLLGARYAELGLDVVRVRPFNHTGPGQAPDFVAPAFARQVAAIAQGRSEPRIAVGNLASVRDFLDVDDVVD